MTFYEFFTICLVYLRLFWRGWWFTSECCSALREKSNKNHKTHLKYMHKISVIHSQNATKKRVFTVLKIANSIVIILERSTFLGGIWLKPYGAGICKFWSFVNFIFPQIIFIHFSMIYKCGKIQLSNSSLATNDSHLCTYLYIYTRYSTKLTWAEWPQMTLT